MKLDWLLMTLLLICISPVAGETNRFTPAYSCLSEHPVALLICLHDVCGNGNQFRLFGEALAKRYKISVYSIDQLGYGGSNHNQLDLRGSEESIQNLVHELKKQHDSLPVFILGEGVGGALALDYCSKTAPNKISGLILANLVGKKSMTFKRSGALYQCNAYGYSKNFQSALQSDPMAKSFFSSKDINIVNEPLLSQAKNAEVCRSRVLMLIGDSLDPKDGELCRQVYSKLGSANKQRSVQSGFRNLFDYDLFDDTVEAKVGDWITHQ